MNQEQIPTAEDFLAEHTCIQFTGPDMFIEHKEALIEFTKIHLQAYENKIKELLTKFTKPHCDNHNPYPNGQSVTCVKCGYLYNHNEILYADSLKLEIEKLNLLSNIK